MRALSRHLLPILIWTLACAAIYGPVAVGARSLPTSDLTDGFYPFAVFQDRELQAGRLAVWSPGSYGGYPFAGDTQAASAYPPRYLTLLLSTGDSLPLQALVLEALVHLWLAGVFLYLLAAALAGRREAGLLAAIAWGLGGYLTGYPVLQLAVLESITWLPLALWCIWHATEAERPLRWLAGAGLALALCALAGHPQTLMQAAYLCAAYFVYRAWRAGWSLRWIVGGGALLAVTALGVSAAGWLPAAAYLRYTERAHVGYAFVSSGLPLEDYLQILVPGALSLFVPQYIGMAGALLAGVAVVHRRRMPAALAREGAFWLGVTLVAGLLALGDEGVLFSLGYRALPGLSFFRQQERWLSLFNLALALLAALGCRTWLDEEVAAVRRALWRVLAVAGALILLAAPALAFMRRGQTAEWLPVLGLAAGLWALCGLLLLAPLARRPRVPHAQALILLLLLLVADLGLVNRRATPLLSAYTVPRDGWSQALSLGGEAVDPAEPVRVDTTGLLTANLGELYGIEDIQGVSPLRPEALTALRTLPRERLHALLDVGYLLIWGPLDEPGLELVAQLPAGTLWLQRDTLYLYRYTTPRARAWLVHDVVTVSDSAAELTALGDEGLDPLATAVLEEGTGAAVSPAAGEDAVTATRLSASELQLDVQAGAAGLLVISEWYEAGWRATVDGAEAPILRADYALQAIEMPAGAHTVRLRYAAPAQFAGLALSGASLLMVLALAILGRWPVTRRREAQAPLPRTGWSRGVATLSTLYDRLEPPARAALDWLARHGGWVLLATVLVGVAVRLLRLGTQELRGDEAFSYLVAIRPWRQIAPTLVALGDPHSPLHYWLLHAAMVVGGDSELAMRLPSALLGLLVIPVAWRLGCAAGDRRAGLLLAALAAIAEPFVWIGQDVRSQTVLAVLFSGLATLALLEMAARARASRRVPLWLPALYGLCAALAVYGFYYAATVLVAHGLYVAFQIRWERGRRALLWAWLAGGALAVALFAPWALAAGRALLASGQLSDPAAPRLAPYLTEWFAILTAGETWTGAAQRAVAIGGLALAAMGARQLWRKDRALAAWAIGATALTGITIYLVRYVRATYEPRYLAVMALPWWLLLAAGMQGLLGGRARLARALGAAALVALLALNVAGTVRYHTDPAYSRTGGYRAAAEIITARAEPFDVFVRNQPDPCWDYYLRDAGMTREMVPAEALQDESAVAVQLEALMARYNRIWFVPWANPAWDPNGLAEHWLEYNALRESWAQAGQQRVAAYRPARTAAQALISATGATLDNGVTLEGYSVLVDGVPLAEGGAFPWREGATLEVTLAWRADAPLARGYTAFVHLVSAEGALLAQHDGVPLLGTRPTTLWEAGELVLDRHTLTLPARPAGDTIELRLGMYDSETVSRALYPDGSDTWRLTLTLAP